LSKQIQYGHALALDSLSRASNNLESVNSFHPIPKEEDVGSHPSDPVEIEEHDTLSSTTGKEVQTGTLLQ
jgi:hypothetical protein